MLQVDTSEIPISVTTASLSRKNSSNSYSSAGTSSLSRRDSSNSYASTGSLSRKNSSNSLQSKQGKRQSPTSTIPFPWKLHRILDDADIKGFNDIISWVPSENGFKVHKTKQFDEDIMPKYFDKTKYKSFQRQLNMWGFDRVGSGPYKGAYLHSCFIRGQPQLCEQMQRTKIKGIHSKKLRKKGDLSGGSSHSLGGSSHSLGGSSHSLGGSSHSLGGSNHSLGDSLGRGSNHSITSISSATPSVSDIEIHASIKRAAEKVADLEQQKEEIQRKLELLSTQTSSMNMSGQPLPLPDDDIFSPLPLSEGDSLLFGGRNYFYSEDGKYTEKPSNQQRRRAGRRYSLQLKGPDSDQYVLKELQGDSFSQGMGGGSNHSLNENFMLPTPLGPDNFNVVTATTNISNRNSSLNIGLDTPARRFSFLSTPVHNPFEKMNQRPPRHPSTSSAMNSNMNASNNNFKMMNMDAMTNNMMNMNMNMNSNMNTKPFDESITYLSGSNSLNNLLRMNS